MNYRREVALARLGVFRECERAPTRTLIDVQGVEGALRTLGRTIGRLEHLIEIQQSASREGCPYYNQGFLLQVSCALLAERTLAKRLARMASERTASFTALRHAA